MRHGSHRGMTKGHAYSLHVESGGHSLESQGKYQYSFCLISHSLPMGAVLLTFFSKSLDSVVIREEDSFRGKFSSTELVFSQSTYSPPAQTPLPP